jgi:hypothetical protein
LDEGVEMEFAHPVHNNVVFAGFEIQAGDKSIKSAVRSNFEADIIYEDNLAKRKITAKASYSGGHSDIIHYYIGSLPSKEPIILTSTFHQLLDTEDLSWRILLPNKIVPRYIDDLTPYLVQDDDSAKKDYSDKIHILEEAISAYYQEDKFT